MTSSHRKPSQGKKLRRPLILEQLEERIVPAVELANVFAHWDGLADPEVEIRIQLTADDFSAGTTRLGFLVEPHADSPFDPQAVVITNAASGLTITPNLVQDDIAGDPSSLVLADLTLQDYIIAIRGESGSSGTFQLQIFLVGDVDGDRLVTRQDGLLLRDAFGASQGTSQYISEADSNLDGRITSFDYAQWRDNQNRFAQVEPITLAAQFLPSPIQQPDGSFATYEVSGILDGVTLANAVVTLDTNQDGLFDDGNVVADSSGHYQFPVSLQPGANLFAVRAQDVFGQFRTVSVPVTRLLSDTIAPVLQIETPIAAGLHSNQARLIGRVSDGDNSSPSVRFSLNGGVETSVLVTSQGRFDVPLSEQPLPAGSHEIRIVARDQAGNETSRTITFDVTPSEFLVGPILSDGWGVKTAQTLRLEERSSFLVQSAFPVALEPVEGTRTLSFDVAAQFDTSDASTVTADRFLVYLLDSSSQEYPLVGSTPPLFSLREDGAEFIPGLVRYDGTTVEIDLTNLDAAGTAQLVVQLVNGDGDSGTVVALSELTVSTDPDQSVGPVFPMNRDIRIPGPAIDLTALAPTTEVEVLASQVQLDPASGLYSALVNLKNHGSSLSRTIVVTFSDLPEGVQLTNASGVDDAGNPYIHFRSALPANGLDALATSSALQVVFDNPNLTRFSLTPQVFVGGPNLAPEFAPIGPLTVQVGESRQIPLFASDPNGDPVTFSLIRSQEASLPAGLVLNGNGQLTIAPRPGSEGTYTFTVVASDGILRTEQTIVLAIEADTVSTTRISGRVLDVGGIPLAGVPVSLSRLTVFTDANGSFTLELPDQLLPTEEFVIEVPQGDVHFDPQATGTQSISFRRARFDTLTGTSPANPRRHPNLVSSFLDASVVYGSDPERALALRTLDGTGRLKTGPGDFLPLNNDDYFPSGPLENDQAGSADPTNLFVAGDVRASENVALASLHTILLREHNRLADAIASATPGLSDEEIYQRARRMVGAYLQHITYTEYLPVLLGANALSPYAGYQPEIDPQVGSFFTTAAYRIGHSQMVAQLLRIDESGNETPGGHLSLQEAFFTSDPIIEEGIDPILRGLIGQTAQQVDLQIIDALRNFLFGPPGSGGMDLPAMTIQRGRDMGLPSYNQARADFGLAPVTSFAAISSDTQVQQQLQAVYGDVDQVDAFVGGLAEDHLPGTLVGELFQVAIAQQFERSRDGDRFWYENGQFTPDELTMIQSTTLADLIERNTGITGLPQNLFTTGSIPPVLESSGLVTAETFSEYRSLNGSGNNLLDPELGSTGQHLLIDASLQYADGISEPAGANRPSARFVSNGLMAQSGSVPDSSGTTALAVFWGQLISHDLSLTPTGTSDTLKIHADQAEIPGKSYPFVAEPLDLLLGHVVYEGVDNVIARPIYLPAIDTANAETIVPTQDTMVTTAAIPGASVFVAAGTLFDQQGNLFSGELSITEVPSDFTPAALPPNLIPDLVVTIQPAEMLFAQPAPLSLPNRAGWEAGTIMDLWSINPLTGEFEDVGDAQVSADGLRVETISGGIRNSSWHFVLPPPPAAVAIHPDNDAFTLDDGCQSCKETADATSKVELHSGALLEMHALVTYQSLGVTRGLTLHYDSLRADPQPILHFGYENLRGDNSTRLVARTTVRQGNFEYVMPGFAGGRGLPGGEHFWRIDLTGSARVGVQLDFRDLPTGVYDYDLDTGIFRLSDNRFTGSAFPQTGQLEVINSRNSEFGAGWGLAGLSRIIENIDGSVLLVDGDGSELRFDPPSGEGQSYGSPAGDFTNLIKSSDGTFQRTFTDQSFEQFDSSGRLVSVTDRNGNQTLFEYNSFGIAQITDPVGLTTVFNYTGNKVTSITDPAGRITELRHDNRGNLKQIIDPDLATRTWVYDAEHRMVGETNARGFSEGVEYNFAGRVIRAIRKDGTEMVYSPLQTQAIHPRELTINPETAPSLFARNPAIAYYAESDGNVMEIQLDQAGQAINRRDSSGNVSAVSRDNDNLVRQTVDGRGFVTSLDYDDRGNVTRITDDISFGASGTSFLDGSLQFSVGTAPYSVTLGDINGDGIPDIVTANLNSNSVTVLIGDGSGGYGLREDFAVGTSPASVQLGDVDNDGNLDIITANLNSSTVTVLLGDGLGGFGSRQDFGVNFGPIAVSLGDVNGDGNLDIVTASTRDGTVAVLQGNGQGGFGSGRSFFVGSNQQSVALADVDSDGDLDIIVDLSFDSIAILLGDGGGDFGSLFANPGAFREINVVGTGPSFVAVEDANNDGVMDLVTMFYTFSVAAVLLGDGNGGFGAPLFSPLGASNPISFALGDVDGDGILDIVSANSGSNDVTVSLGDGTGRFDTPQNFKVGSMPRSVELEDVDRDGDLDIIVANTNSNNAMVLRGDGSGGFAARRDFAIGDPPRSAALGDLDGDGHPDLVTANANSSSVSVLSGNGTGGFDLPQNLNVGSSPHSLALLDLDDDGDLDILTIVTVSSNADSVTVLLADGFGGFDNRIDSGVGLGGVFSAAVGDVDGDGILDVVAIGTEPSTNSRAVAVLFGNGTGSFAEPISFPIGFVPLAIELGDINGDAYLDLVIANASSNSATVFLGDGTGSFNDGGDFAVGNGPSALALGDIDGDGDLDIVSANAGSGNVTVLLGDGTGTFGSRQDFPVDGNPIDLMLQDVNGDGDLDIVTANLNSASVTVLQGTGGGNFGSRQDFTVGAEPRSVVLGDLDGDGSQDLIAANSASRTVSVILGTSIAPTATPFILTYDPVFSQITSITDELGHLTLYDIDPANGNTLAIRQVIGLSDLESGEDDDLVTSFTYTVHGLVDTMTDPLGRMTDYDYDAYGRLTSVTFVANQSPSPFVQHFRYDVAGNQISVIDENGNQTDFSYDEMNRLIQITEADPDGSGPLSSPVTHFTRDLVGNVLTTTDARNNTTVNQYDAMNRLIVSIDPNGQPTNFHYDVDGLLKSITDPLGQTVHRNYDARGRLIESIDADGGSTRFRYDKDNNLISLTDPANNQTRFFYDQRSRLIREIDPLGQEMVYKYDAADILISKIDRNGRETVYEYDDINRPIREIWLASDGSVLNQIEFSYDKASNLLLAVDAFSSYTFTFDSRNRTQSVSNAGTPYAPEVVLVYDYDWVGNVLSVSDTINGVSGAITTYSFDALNRTTQILQTGNQVSNKRVDLTYNELGQFVSIDRFADLAGSQLVVGTALTYDSLNRLIDLRHSNVTEDVAFYQFTFDADSRITQIIDVDGITNYSYDDRDQLIGAEHSDDAKPDENYQYEANGNRTSSHLHGNGYVTGAGNRLLSDGIYEYEYDNEGNRIRQTDIATGVAREFEWDHRNRLVAITDLDANGMPVQRVEFSYDLFDRRIRKSVDTDPTDAVDAVFTHFVYDREDVFLDFVDADGAGPNESILGKRYLHGLGIDQVFAQEYADGTVQWHLTDHLGTVRDLVDQSGIVVNHIIYDSFGRVISQSESSFETRYLFTGREYDPETGLYYYRARYYDAETGRFVSEDPIGFEGGDENLYRYVLNSSPNLTDPSGNAFWVPLFWVANFIYSAYDAYETVTDPCADIFDKATAGLGLLPGGKIFRAGKLARTGGVGNAPTRVAQQTLGRSPSSRILGENLEAIGRTRPANSDAHHIVAGTDARAAQARAILQREGIDINEAANGVFLPRNRSVASPPAATHSTTHTYRYYQEVEQRLLKAAPGTVRTELDRIANELLNGTFPF